MQGRADGRAIIGAFVKESDAQQRTAPKAGEDEPMLYCPVCSTRLISRKCKLICEQCGYYLSCADYY